MISYNRDNLLLIACGLGCIALALVGMPDRVRAAVVINDDPNTIFFLDKPTGKFDEPSFGGFNYLISSRSGGFQRNDQYINVGDETNETTAIANDLGTVDNLSGLAFDFSITHTTNKHFSFSLSNDSFGISALCWGIVCPAGSISTPTLDGKPPIKNYNGLQLQVRAQDDFFNPIPGASASIENLTLTGVDIAPGGAPLLPDITVTPDTPSEPPLLPLDPDGRVGQWILGNDLVLFDWVLAGTITLARLDEALEDRNKVRLAVDFVKDLRIAPIPVPAALPLFFSGMALLGVFLRRRRGA